MAEIRQAVLSVGLLWDGPAQLTFRGIDKLAVDEHPLTGMLCNNLTFRAAA
jgi:hypothetical protein